MKRARKKSTVLAIVFISIGLSLILTSLLLSNFHLVTFSSLQFSDVPHKILRPFDSIQVEEIDCSIRILPAEDELCTVVSQEVPNLFNHVSVEDGVLTVRRQDERAWHERILVFGSANPILTIYLPASHYTSLSLRSTAGNILVEAPISFETVNLKTVSGDISLKSKVTDSITLSANSGNIAAENQNVSDFSASAKSGNITLHHITASLLEASTTSGKLRFDTGITAENLFAESTKGDMVFTDVTVKKTLTVQAVSGNVAFFNIEFGDAYVENASGNVTGTLRTKKRFDVQSASGVILHPDTHEGALLRVRTVSGNVSFTVLDEQH